jgi:hypothetical protein
MAVHRAPQRHRHHLALVEEHRPQVLQTVGAAGLGVGAGAMVEYLLDPERGRSRRARVRDKGTRAAHELNGGIGVIARDFSNRSRGVAAGARYRLTSREVDDRILHERVRAELGRHVSHPHAVEVKVYDGTVTLKGEVLAAEANAAERAVARVPGVKAVDCRWDAHTDAEGVPGLQGPARPRHPVPELLQQSWSPTARLLTGTAALAGWAVSGMLPRPAAWAMRGAATALAVRAATNHPMRDFVKQRGSFGSRQRQRRRTDPP